MARKSVFTRIFIIFYDDLLDLLELVLVCSNDVEQATLTINNEGVDGQAGLLLDIIPCKMSNPGSCRIFISRSLLAITYGGVQDNHVLISHDTKHRVAGAGVGQLVVLG